jgi:protein-S-isoprenylcysteine O-methyltransferase Ste14
MNPAIAEIGLWGAWLLYWAVAARGAARAEWRESRGARLAHVIPLCAAAMLLSVGTQYVGPLSARWLPAGMAAAWLGVAITAAGLGFSVWARLHLGRNWSAEIELKEGHRLIRSGPYRCARHPIYTGVLGGFLGSAVALGEWRGLLALALAFAAFWVKSRREETVLVDRFGAEYAAYRREVKALIPGVI